MWLHDFHHKPTPKSSHHFHSSRVKIVVRCQDSLDFTKAFTRECRKAMQLSVQANVPRQGQWEEVCLAGPACPTAPSFTHHSHSRFCSQMLHKTHLSVLPNACYGVGTSCSQFKIVLSPNSRLLLKWKPFFSCLSEEFSALHHGKSPLIGWRNHVTQTAVLIGGSTFPTWKPGSLYFNLPNNFSYNLQFYIH